MAAGDRGHSRGEVSSVPGCFRAFNAQIVSVGLPEPGRASAPWPKAAAAYAQPLGVPREGRAGGQDAAEEDAAAR